MLESGGSIGDMQFDGQASSLPLTVASLTWISSIISAISIVFSKGWNSSSIGKEVLGYNLFRAIRL